MRALTLWQPWASLVEIGAKSIETRSWSTSYRGALAIHAAATWIGIAGREGNRPEIRTALAAKYSIDEAGLTEVLPFGAVVATCELVDVYPIVGPGDQVLWGRPYVAWWSGAAPGSPDASLHVWEEDEAVANITGQAPFGDFSPGRYAWMFEDITPLAEPVPARGRQQLWEWAA